MSKILAKRRFNQRIAGLLKYSNKEKSAAICDAFVNFGLIICFLEFHVLERVFRLMRQHVLQQDQT